GQVAGSSYTNFEPNPITGAPPLHSFLWENGKMIDLGTLGGALSGPLAINNRGQVVGSSTTANEEHTNPFFWESGRPIDLFKATKGKVITANAINDAGQVVGGGDFSNVGGSPFSAVLWSKGAVINLGTLPGDCFSEAYAIMQLPIHSYLASHSRAVRCQASSGSPIPHQLGRFRLRCTPPTSDASGGRREERFELADYRPQSEFSS